MNTWARMGATALGTSIVLVGPTAALASAGDQPPTTRPAPSGPPPARPSIQAAGQLYVLPSRDRSVGTARATSIALVHLADTEQLA